MSLQQVLLLVATVSLMSIGQILFKLAANDLSGVNFSTISSLVKIFTPWLMVALVCYALSTATWVGVLRITPLSRAYPFIALAFVIVPFLSSMFIGEKLRWNVLAGAVLILIGVFVSSMDR